jgi:hypothetical protein
MEKEIPKHLKDVPTDKLDTLSEIHKPRNSIGFAEDLAELVEESKPKVKTFVVNATETVCYKIKVQAIDDEQAKELVLSGYDHNGKSIDWDKCRSDAFDFDINSVQDGYITIVEPD